MKTNHGAELASFLDDWSMDPNLTKACFLKLKQHLETMDGVRFDFVARPGITYSLRAAHDNQTRRSLFAMVDVIDDDPEDRWLSICFYRELVDDPDSLGDEVPGGLMGEDARCFDMYESDDPLLDYIKERLKAACAAASREC
ncbi:MAG: hypothetical protein V3571_15415 [Pseudodesulfovibrio sp.]